MFQISNNDFLLQKITEPLENIQEKKFQLDKKEGKRMRKEIGRKKGRQGGREALGRGRHEYERGKERRMDRREEER